MIDIYFSAQPLATRRALRSCPGLQPHPRFDAFVDGEGRSELLRIQTDAEAAGVFGVPTFVLDGELF